MNELPVGTAGQVFDMRTQQWRDPSPEDHVAEIEQKTLGELAREVLACPCGSTAHKGLGLHKVCGHKHDPEDACPMK